MAYYPFSKITPCHLRRSPSFSSRDKTIASACAFGVVVNTLMLMNVRLIERSAINVAKWDTTLGSARVDTVAKVEELTTLPKT